MKQIFEFSNWDQLTRAVSSTFPNLKISVTHFNTPQLTATRIGVYDVNTEEIYYYGFVDVISTEVFNISAEVMKADMINILNSYGFDVRAIKPLPVPEKVITILKGFKELGYLYLTMEYTKTETEEMKSHIVLTDTLRPDAMKYVLSDSKPKFTWADYTWVRPNTIYPIQRIITKGEA